MTRWLVPLITLGCFCVLASYAQGRYERGHKQVTAHHAAAPVILSRDSGIVYATQHDCGENWLCLLAWSEEQNPKTHKKGRRS